MIDIVASVPWYLAHLSPVWAALPPELQGRVIVPRDLDAQVRAMGAEPSRSLDGDAPVLVAGWSDYHRAARAGRTSIAEAQHGIGQSYTVAHQSYPGGQGRLPGSLFLVPNEHAAGRWRTAYPSSTVAVVGSPRLDALPAYEPDGYSIGIECDPWSDLVAAIRSPLRTPGSGPTGGPCVAHAITDRSASEPSGSARPVTTPRPSTTGSDTDAPTPAQGRTCPSLGEITDALTSAIASCTSDSGSSCPGRAISADRPTDLRWLSDGTLQRSIGGSTTEGSHILRIQTTTFGSASLVIPCTTAKAGTAGPIRTHEPLICLSSHWDVSFVPEGRSGFHWIAPAIPELARRFRVIGHAHPRIAPTLERWYRQHGIEFVPDFDDVVRRAALYVTDNSSSLYEFASTGRPVVVLNAPWYRRDTEHGLRFWSASRVGVNVDRPDDLSDAVALALSDPPEWQAEREAALRIVYAYRSGASERAADALIAWASERQEAAA